MHLSFAFKNLITISARFKARHYSQGSSEKRSYNLSTAVWESHERDAKALNHWLQFRRFYGVSRNLTAVRPGRRHRTRIHCGMAEDDERVVLARRMPVLVRELHIS